MTIYPITPNMVAVLRFAREGRSLYSMCFNRSDHGARTCSIMAVRRRGLLDGDALTDAGNAELDAALKRGL